METITSSSFLEPINSRLKDLYDMTNRILISTPDKTDAELHFARGRLNGLNDAFTIINEENSKVVEKLKKGNEPQDEVSVSEEVISELV